ncbi:MAG: ASCH domain-containing protein [Chloroflexota bacterium]
MKHPQPIICSSDPAPDGIQNRAISIRQPYAEAILRGIKKIEYRSQPTRIRGRVYLYASLQFGNVDLYPELRDELEELPKGFLLGTVEIVACYKLRYWNRPTEYEWHLANPERLSVPLKPERRPQPVWFKPF